MTNADVIKLCQAGLDPSVVITAITNAEPGFDASPEGLIALTNAKVPKAVVEAVILRASGKGASSAAGKPAQATGEALDPGEVLLLGEGEPTSMRYITAQLRTAARGMGFGGVASYFVLRGTSATAHTKNKSPRFLVSVPKNAQPESYLTLVSLAVRKNGTREVMIGGGYMSYSTGFPAERVVALAGTKAEDQSRAPDGHVLYEVTPRNPLATGEYALVVETAYASHFAMLGGQTGTAFDFAVDS